jgi:selenium metabolism protein YedF
LGAKLMKNFLATLGEMDNLWRIILVNNAVEMAVPESTVFSELKRLEDTGVSILVCGTCLSHFHLLEQKAVGETTNMLDVITSLHLAEKVISI